MSDDSDMDYASGSEAECGLEEQYYSAKEASASGSIEEAVRGLENIVETDVDHTKWGFKALKRIVKLLIRKNLQQAQDYYGRLFAYVGSRSITSNDADKALDSLWIIYCESVTDADARRGHCLTTFTHLQALPGRLTRLKWLARLAQQCPSEDHQRQLDSNVDSFQQVAEDAIAMDVFSDVAKGYLIDALSLTTLLFLRHKRYTQVESNLDRLSHIAVDSDRAVECNAFVKEMKARVAFVRGKYAASFQLLWGAKRLYEECKSTSSQRVHLHLRLVSLLLPKAGENAVHISDRMHAIPANYSIWTTECALVEDIVQCFNDGDVARLRSTAKDAQAELGHFAAVELCGALIRNRMFRRMAPENCLDTFACLSRWDVDVLNPVGRRLSDFVDANAHVLPLKNISKVSLENVDGNFPSQIQRVTLTVQTERGSTTFCKESSHDQKWDVFREGLYSWNEMKRRLESLLANAFVEMLYLKDSPWSCPFQIPSNNRASVRIKRISHIFGEYYTHSRLLRLQAFGDVSVEHMEVRFDKLVRVTSGFLEPLSGARVEDLRINFFRVENEEEAETVLAFCFDRRPEGTTPRFQVHNATRRINWLKRIGENARWSSCDSDVSIEVHLCAVEHFSHMPTGFNNGSKESSEYPKITNVEWENSRVHFEMGPQKLLAYYSPKRT